MSADERTAEQLIASIPDVNSRLLAEAYLKVAQVSIERDRLLAFVRVVARGRSHFWRTEAEEVLRTYDKP